MHGLTPNEVAFGSDLNLNVEPVLFEDRKLKPKNGIKFPIVFSVFTFPKTHMNCRLPVLNDLAVNGNIRVLFLLEVILSSTTTVKSF